MSVIIPNLLLGSYITLLYLTGHFNDWQELITEPYFILRGLKNYSDIATHHAPLLTEFLAIIYRLVGTDTIIRMVLLILISTAIALLIFRATHRLAGKHAGFYSIVLFAIFWPFYGGTHFWFDTFLPMFYVIAFALIIERDSPKRLFLAGISMGLSFLIKQTGGVVALVIFAMLLARQKPTGLRIKDSLIFAVGVVVPIIIVALWYASTEQLADAYYWMIEYNLSGYYVKLGRQRPPMDEILRLLVITVPIMLFLIAACFSKAKRQQISWEFLLALSMGFSASFTIFPRWERFHVAPSIPFLVISLVVSCKFLMIKTGTIGRIPIHRVTKAILYIWIFGILLDVGTFYPPLLVEKIIPHFTRLWPLRSYDPPHWVDESFIRYLHDVPAVGRYLREVTAEGDKIFVWGWLGSRIYFESNRLPGGKFYYPLPWFTCLPRFRKDLLIGLERDYPRYVVVLKRHYPGTPSLEELGIDLDELGYTELSDMKERFPQVAIWRSRDPRS